MNKKQMDIILNFVFPKEKDAVRQDLVRLVKLERMSVQDAEQKLGLAKKTGHRHLRAYNAQVKLIQSVNEAEKQEVKNANNK